MCLVPRGHYNKHLRASTEAAVAAVRTACASHVATAATPSRQLCGQRTAVRGGVDTVLVEHGSGGVVLLRNGHVFRYAVLLQELVALVVATHTHFLDLQLSSEVVFD